MGPKQNRHVIEANSRNAEKDAKNAAKKAEQDEARAQVEWSAGSNQRGAKRAEDDAAKAAEKERQRLEKKRLEELEEASMPAKGSARPPARIGGGGGIPSSIFGGAGGAASAAGRPIETVTGTRGVVERDFLVENTNHVRNNDPDALSASGIDDALAILDIAARGEAAAGPPKSVNLKAAYAAFEEREMAKMKVDRPGLKLSQYKERIFALWGRSPENPKNQIAAAAAAGGGAGAAGRS